MRAKFILWLMGTNFYKYVLLNIIPFVRFSMYYTKIRGNKYHEGWNILKPGHIILTVDDKKLTSLLIPGTMSHAALCVNHRKLDPRSYEIAEMTHTNYTRSDFFDICKESSRVLIAECTDWSPEYIPKVIEACNSLRAAKYDLEFEFGVKALYCSELVVQADKIAYQKELKELDAASGRGLQLRVDFSDLAGLGRPYISPDGLLFGKNVRVLWDSEGLFSGKMGPEIERIIYG